MTKTQPEQPQPDQPEHEPGTDPQPDRGNDDPDREWVVKMPGGFVAFTGEERQARRYSRIMNRRLASEELGVEYRRFASTARSSWG
jgi:hypothetical protein